MTKSRLFAGLLLLFFLGVAVTAIGQKKEENATKTYFDVPEKMWERVTPAQVVVITRQVVVDYQCISAPGNPPTGLVRVYCDSGTGNLTCLTSTGASCISSGGGGGTISGSGTNNNVAKFTAGTVVGNSSVVDDGTNPTQTPNGTTAVTNGFYRQIANANPGSTINRAVCLNSSAQAITCATNATSGVAGIAGQGAGNSGNVQVCMIGVCTAEFDNQSTVGDWAILSTTTAGRMHDTGLTTETTGNQNFFIYSANSGAGTTANVGILNPDVISGGSSGGGRGTNVQVNGTNAQPTLNLNASTPAPGAGFLAMTRASSNSGNTTSAIDKVPISGNTSTVASASTISGTTNICGDGSGNVTTVGCTANALPGVTNISGTAYTLLTTDNAKTVTVANASPATITLPAPGGSAPIQQTVALTFLACTATCASKAFTPTNTGDLVVITIENPSDATVTVTGITAGHTTFNSAGAKITWSGGTLSDTVWYSFNTPNTADTYTPTVTNSGGSQTLTIHIMDYNTVQTSSDPKDAYVTANGTSPPPTTGNAQTTANNELLVAMIAGTSCGIDSTLGSGYTSRVGTASMASSGGVEDQVVAIPGTYVGNATNASGCTAWSASLTSFKMTSGVSFPNGYYVTIQNTGAGLVTIARGSANIDGAAANLTLQTNQGVLIVTDGKNWFTMRGDATGLPMNGVVSATGAIATIANGNNPLVINCALTSGTTCLTTGETTAASTAGAVEHQITTLTTSTAIGLQITQGANGPANANAPAVLNVSAAAAGGLASASNAGSVGAPVTLLTGAGSAGGATTGIGGAGGAFTLTSGAGGAAGGTSTNNGGSGGAFTITTGAGGNGGSGVATAGSGGGFAITLGAPGTNSATGTAGTVGKFSISGNAPASTANAAGVATGTVFQINGIAGGASSNAAGTAGIGSLATVSGGIGGAGTGTNAVGGAGGTVTLTAGNGGGSLGTGVNSNGGNIILTPGSAGSGGSGTAGLAGVVSVGGANAGFVGLTQGSVNTTLNTNIPANTIIDQAPTSVTAYALTRPGVAAQGAITNIVTSAVDTQGFSGDANHSTTVTTGSGTSIGSTSLCSTANCPVGTYRVNVYIDITTACGTSGTYVVNLIYTDDQGSKTIPVNINGTGAVPATGVLTTTSTANFGENAQIIRSTGAASINYSTTAVACGTAGPMVGKLYLSVEPVQ